MSDLSWIILLIPAFPLLGFLLNAFVFRREREAGLVASAAVVLAFVAAVAAVVVLHGQPMIPIQSQATQAQPELTQRIDFVLTDWISIGAFRIPFGLLFDQLTAVMTLLITGVGALIHLYSIGYMHDDVRPVRYFAYLNLFIVMMLILVMADNLLVMFLGWEGVGLASFLLIGHYFDRRTVQPGIEPSNAAIKAFVVNRIGDAGLLLGMMLIFSRLGSLSFYTATVDGQPLAGFLERINDIGFNEATIPLLGTISVVTAMSWLLLIGVMGKSAQVPLFVWLPDAMAGPTPVSALIHAATMVTAGVYLIARTHPIFAASPSASGAVVAIGVLTALIGAFAAVTQFDIKRVLAYSTMSQLGYMVAAVGMGATVAGMFHLLTHGIFKALLFLAAGAVIHGVHENQDMRRMGGLRDKMPLTFWTYLIGALSLAGIVPFAGFWSKDEIISYMWFTRQNAGGAIILIMISMLTAFYMGRQIALIFYGQQRDTSYEAHESTGVMRIVLVILAIGTVLGGLINFPGLHWLASYIGPVVGEAPEDYTLGMGVLATITTLLAVGSGLGGWYVYAYVYATRVRVGKDDPLYRYTGDIWRGFEQALGFDYFYTHYIVRGYRSTARFLSSVFDAQAIDGILVEGTGRLVGQLSLRLRGAQNGYVRSYLLIFLVGVVVLLGYFTLMS